MGDSSRVQIYEMPEVTFGVIPATAFNTVRFTGESLKYNIANTQSKEIRKDRNVPDIIQVNAEAQGGLQFELSYGNLDDMISGMMMSAWGATLSIVASTISASSVDNSINDSGAGFPAFVVGQWIKIQGFTGACAGVAGAGAACGYGQVVSRTSAKIVVSGITLVTDASGESVTVVGAMIRNGTTKKSYVVEKEFADITKFISYTGMVVSSLNLDVSAGSIITGDLQFMGKSASAPIGTTVGTGAAAAPPANPVMNAVSNVAAFFENGAALAGTYAKAYKISVNNGLRGKNAIGVLGNIDIGLGDFMVTGSLETYFEDTVIYNKFRNATESSIAVRVVDSSNNCYIITLPNIEYTDGNIVAGGINQDVMAQMQFQAKLHTTLNCTMQIDRFAAP